MEDLNQTPNQSSNQSQSDNEGTGGLSEKQLLMQRCRLLGIPFSNNASEDTLRQKITEKLEGTKADTAEEKAVNPLGEIEEQDTSPAGIRRRLYKEQMKLVRIRVTCMNPNKADLPGEIFTIANEYLGTVSKFVPFGEATDDGYHVPQCIYQMMKDRKFLHIQTKKDKKSGANVVTTRMALEFAIEVMPQLKPDELKRLATAQIAAGSIDGASDEQVI